MSSVNSASFCWNMPKLANNVAWVSGKDSIWGPILTFEKQTTEFLPLILWPAILSADWCDDSNSSCTHEGSVQLES